MQIVTGVNIYNKILDASCVTIGNFDGVHRGHAEIFAHLKYNSMIRHLPSVVVTFEPHPLKVLAPEYAPSQITTFDQKVALIEESGIDYLFVIPFTKEFSRLSASNFVVEILCKSLGMRHIIIGHDYAFGRGREGNFSTLEALGKLNGFTLEDLPPIGEDAVIFSSSLVRSVVLEGDMTAASKYLGRYYQISGTVVHGRAIGSALGFPTANIATVNELIPSDGVYAVMVEVDGLCVNGACNIGCNPTFGGKTQTIEVFLLDFSEQIYDHRVKMAFIQRIRSVQKFPNGDALKEAISRDVLEARLILAECNKEKRTTIFRPESRA
ncbi:MAG: bifunctional riboflavin kinase/FAD synthetase [Desulfuromonadaceae bacterium]|nr:bifunctional riboflavin kinase/FAD synthetase [Desulfuromonadaceae bacterium]